MKLNATLTVSRSSARAGFSLLELLAVMAILAILMTFLAFRLGGLSEVAKQSTTETFLQQIGLAVKSFESETGNYPKSTWDAAWGPTPNKTNLGGEILCLQLWGKDVGGSGISDDQLGNIDLDETKKSVTTHGNNDLFELIDAWDNPIAYFHRQDYGREDTYLTLDGTGVEDTSLIRALKNPKTNNYFNPREFQLISAGQDGIFGPNPANDDLNDDLYNFKFER